MSSTTTTPTSLPDQLLQWLYRVLQPEYKFPILCYQDISLILMAFPRLRPRTRIYLNEFGTQELLLNIHGDLVYKSTHNNINNNNNNIYTNDQQVSTPIEIWIPLDYPRRPPIIYVTPNENFIIVPNNYIDFSGKFYHPFISNWSNVYGSDTSNDNVLPKNNRLLKLINIVKDNFKIISPLVPKPAAPKLPEKPDTNISQLQSPSQSQDQLSSTISPQQRQTYINHPVAQLQATNMNYGSSVSLSSASTYNTSMTGATASFRSPQPPTPVLAQPPAPAQVPAPPPPPPPPQLPPTPITQTKYGNNNVNVQPGYTNNTGSVVYSPATSNANITTYNNDNDNDNKNNANFYTNINYYEEELKREQEKRLLNPDQNSTVPLLPPNPHKITIIKTLENKISEILNQDIKNDIESNIISYILKNQYELNELSDKYTKSKSSIEYYKKQTVINENLLITKINQLKKILNESDSKNEILQKLDNIVVAESVVYNQLYDLITSDESITDTLYYLEKSHDNGSISFDNYLKFSRNLAREQCMLKLHIEKLIDCCGLQV
ncbi:unnamed protein product [[Candida] boidinii]|uniref:Unnamed protein product n=1 Tax=Candida boidinii TaxID=5477 RepID=A0A9W6SX51_CANBO|nr:hypothetical protein B5S33_g2938 [[Candida] boidinii]GME66727.1 unnamed protein product [[Candida] boidinii]GMG07314.1 unnamed protein product [[Candida] boidinii]